MEKLKSKIIIEDYKNNFDYKKNNTSLNIEFNRVAFVFFFFFGWATTIGERPAKVPMARLANDPCLIASVRSEAPSEPPELSWPTPGSVPLELLAGAHFDGL